MTGFIIKYRAWIIVLSICTGLFFLVLIPYSETDPEIRNYIPQSLDSKLVTDTIETEFGSTDMIILLINDTSVVEPEILTRIKLTEFELEKLPWLSGLMSPFTASSVKSSEGMMLVEPLISELPQSREEIEILKKEISENEFARDVVFSDDFETAAITATVTKDINENLALGRVDSITSLYFSENQVLKGGLPYIRRHILEDVRHDAMILVPAALALMLLLLRFTLGGWRSVFIPFSVVLISSAISMGLIPLLGWKISIITLLAPIILIAVSNNYGIYLVVRYKAIRDKMPGSPPSLITAEVMSSLTMPVLFSGLTTVAGISGLLTHSIIPARQLGILAMAGVGSALLLSLVFIPALLQHSYCRGRQTTNIKEPGYFGRFSRWLSDKVLVNHGRIICLFGILTLLMAAGTLLLRTETNQENFFPSSHPVKKASELINKKFGGSQTVSVMVKGDIINPELMKRIDRLCEELSAIEGVGKVFSISEAVLEMSRAIFAPGEQGYGEIPSSREGIAQLFELYYMSGDSDDFKELLNFENTKAHILIRLSRPDNDVIRKVRNVTEQNTAGLSAQVLTGGYAIIMADFARLIIRGQLSSLLLALVTIFILLTLIFRSLQGGLIGIIPLFCSILLLFGFMGVTGIALDSATALISSVMVGTGVDFTIQYIWSFKSYLNTGLTHDQAMKQSLVNIGPSILINALTLMAGFTILIFSGFGSIRFFGLLVILSVSSCLFGALILIPAILIRYKPGFLLKISKNSGQ